MADFGKAWLAPDAAAGLMVLRVEAGEGCDLAGIGESLRLCAISQPGGDTALAQAGNGVEQIALGTQVGIVVDSVGNGLLDPFQLGGQPCEVGVETVASFLHAGSLKAVLLLGLHLDQRLMAGDQGAQGAVRGKGRDPGGRAFLAAKVGQDAGIDGVGLGADAVGLGMGLDQSRVDHRYGVAGFHECLGGVLPIDAGGFHAGVYRCHAVFFEPLEKRGVAIWRVGEGFIAVLAAVEQGAVQLGLGDIDAEKNGGKVVHDVAQSTL